MNGQFPLQRDYVNGFEYTGDGENFNNRLEHFPMDEGRMRPTTAGGSTYRYEFDLKDHLGNVRVTISDINGNGIFDNLGAEVLQADDFYPFGNRITRKQSSSVNNYTYNGKEHENDFGLNWYHYGARYYDPNVGRWWVVDPVDEFFSGFCYVGNNPINFIDPNGMVADEPSSAFWSFDWLFSLFESAEPDLTGIQDFGSMEEITIEAERPRDMTAQFNYDLDNSIRNVQQTSAMFDGRVGIKFGSFPIQTFYNKCLYFKSIVNTNEKYDLKNGEYSPQLIGYYSIYNEEIVSYDFYGNYMYGAITKAMGIPLNVALLGAGLNQWGFIGKSSGPVDLTNFEGYGDQESDTRAIISGYNHVNK